MYLSKLFYTIFSLERVWVIKGLDIFQLIIIGLVQQQVLAQVPIVFHL